jgi:hypothetical protein
MHLDIKPENMLVGRHYEILLSDFGLTTVAPDPEVESSENIAGTIPYMAPEQFQGKPCQASDQYALGVVVYEWLCGSCPFEGSAEEIENQHLSTSPQPLRERVSGISPLVEFVILTALAKDPLDRFASVQAFANALERAYIAESVAAPWGAAPWGVGQGSWGTVPSIGQRTVSSIGQRSIAHAQQPQDSPAVITGEITVIASSPRHRWMGDLNKYSSDERQASVSSPPLLASQYTPNPEQASVPFPTLSIPKDFPGEEKGIADEFHLSLFAFARATLEKDDGAFVNKTYSLQAGISQNKPADFDGEPFDLTVSDHAKSLTFDILVHESENIELSTKWHKRLRYDPRIEEPQFVEFTFQVIESGHSSLIVDFYHERRWLRTIRIEFESIEESQFIVSSAEV